LFAVIFTMCFVCVFLTVIRTMICYYDFCLWVVTM